MNDTFGNYKHLGIDLELTEEEKERLRKVRNEKSKFNSNKSILALPTAMNSREKPYWQAKYDRMMDRLVEIWGNLEDYEN